MRDIIALAFQTDKTRGATLLLCSDIFSLFRPFRNVRWSHHSSSHRDLRMTTNKSTATNCSHLAYLAQKLDRLAEGEEPVLGHSYLPFLSNMWSGSKPDSPKLPIVQVGGTGWHNQNRSRPGLPP